MEQPKPKKTLHFSIEPGFDANLILREVAKIRTTKNGRSSFNGFEYHYLLPIVVSSIRASKDAVLFKEKCIKTALSDADLELNDASAFVERCENALAELLASPTQTFRVLFDVTYSGPRIIQRLKDGECSLHWQPSEKSSFMKNALAARKKLTALSGNHASLQPQNGMTTVVVTTEAIDFQHALYMARDSVDRLRGLINFLANRNRSIRLFGGTPHAVNKMRLGPFQTIHNLDGTSAIEQIWYEPNWHHSQETIKFSGSEKEIQKGIRQWWKTIVRNPMADHISEGLLRYCRSLDQHDSDAALIGLWGALEALTGTQMLKYEVTVSRIQRLFPDHSFSRQIAHHLRLRRNAHIHAARSPGSEEVDMVLHHADRLVSGVLDFYIRFGRHFRNVQESYDFMDHSLNLDSLRRQRQLIDRSLSFRSKATSTKKA